MRKEQIISKGKYTRQQPEGLIGAKQYLFIRDENGMKRLLLRFSNNRNEFCSKFAFVVYQLDVKGNVLGQERLESAGGGFGPKAIFAFDQKIEVEERCTDVIVQLVYARYGNYTYHVENEEISVTYSDKNSLEGRRPGFFKAKLRKIHTRSFEISWVFILIAVIALACVFGATGYLLRDYQDTNEEFTLSGVNYEFEDPVAKTDVIITGCSDNFREIVLTNEIDGHKVVGIKRGAFKKNENLYKITIDSIDIDDEAFKDCTELETIIIKNVTRIGERAFEGCDSLESVTVEEGKKGQLLSIGTRAFADCENLKSVEINQTIVYGTQVDYFVGAKRLESLKLKNFAYTMEGVNSYYVTRLNNLFGETTLGKSTSVLKTLEIENMDYIPAHFVSGFTKLQSFKTGSQIESIGDRAFSDCAKLSKVSYKGQVESIGSYAFASTAITTLDMNKVSTLGSHVFYNNTKLTSVVGLGMGGIDNIPASTFEGCKSLAEFKILGGIKLIATDAFKNSGLTSLTIPEGVECSLGIIRGCDKLATLELHSLGENGFVAFYFGASDPNTDSEQLASLVSKGLKTVILGTGDVINKSAFAGCSSVEAIYLPEGIVSFGDYAFAGCKKLKTIDVPATTLKSIGMYAFKDTNIESLEISSTVEYIGEGALSGCNNIRSLTVPFLGEVPHTSNGNIKHLFGGDAAEVPQSLATISLVPSYTMVTLPDYAFAGCGGAATINIPSTISVVGDGAFLDCKSLAYVDLSNVTSIGKRAFAGCKTISYIQLSPSLNILGENAFKDTGITVLEIPSGVKSIGFGVIEDCTKIVSITTPYLGSSYESTSDANIAYMFGDSSGVCENIPKSLTSVILSKKPVGGVIGNYAFYNCSGVTSFVIPSGITYIGESAFYGCSSLSSFDFQSVGYIGRAAFSGTGLTSAEIPDTVTEIEEYTFENCQKLTSVKLPSTINTIGASAFENTAIKEINLSNGLWVIEDNAFKGTQLTSIKIPGTVSYIGSNVLEGCDNISELEFPLTSDFENSYGKVCYYLFNAEFPSTLKKITVNGCANGYIYREAFANSSYLEEVIINAEVYGVYSGAFEYCTELRFVFLPSMIDSVSSDAFVECYHLYEIACESWYDVECVYTVSYPGSYNNRAPYVTTSNGYTFARYNGEWYLINYEKNKNISPDASFNYNGSTIDSYHIPSYLFYNDELVEKITLPKSVRSVGKGTFSSCGALKTVSFAKDSFVQRIEKNTFAYCTNLEQVVLPDGVKSIGEHAFEDCARLESVSFPIALETIGERAFYSCATLNCVKLYERVTHIGDNAFDGCGKLYDVYNLSGLKIVAGQDGYGNVARNAVKIHTSSSATPSVEVYIKGIGTFRKSGAAWLLIDGENTSRVVLDTFKFEDETVSSFRILHGAFKRKYNVVEVVIGNAVKQIQDEAFYDCDALVNVDMSTNNSLSIIEERAFAYSSSLRYVKLPRGLEIIEDSAFRGCDMLESVEMPTQLTTIGSFAFAECQRLISITLGARVTDIGENAFLDCVQLFEVYDLSPYITVTRGEGTNGKVAYYADTVFTSASNSLERYEQNGVKMIKAFDKWCVYSYTGTTTDVVTVPERSLDIVILPYAFSNAQFKAIILPVSLYEIRANAFSGCYNMNTVYYAGDSEQWYRIHDDAGVGYNGLYFYEKCVHFGDYSVWTYASNGMPTTEVCKESDSITLQPTCYKDGVRTHYCDCAGCDYTRTTYVSKLAHSFKDNVCSHCGDMRIAVDENSFAAYVENGTIAVDRFEFDGDFGGAVSTNKTHSSVSRLTINITEKTTLSFTYGSSSEYGADYITIYVNGISWGRLSGMNTSYFNSLLEAGDVVEICYSKDESVSSNDDMGYIKDIQLIVANKQSN